MPSSPSPSPDLGFGLGLRTAHYASILEEKPDVDFFEVISENYMIEGGKPLGYLDRISEQTPVVLHGVSLSIGGAHPLDDDYLQQLGQLARRVNARWVSDHLCWVGTEVASSFDLLPLPMTEQVLSLVAQRVDRVQTATGRVLLLENVSTYLRFESAELSEAEFFNELCRRSGAKMLLDVNNVYVNARNHDIDPFVYLDALDLGIVGQIHLAGHTDRGDHVIDTHDAAIVDEVFALYRHAVGRLGPISTSIERDDHIPPLAELVGELNRARQESERALHARRTA